jgi:hypothetical protein
VLFDVNLMGENRYSGKKQIVLDDARGLVQIVDKHRKEEWNVW